MKEEVKQKYLGSLNKLNKDKKKGILITVDGISSEDAKLAHKLAGKIIDQIPPKYYRLYKRHKGKFQMKQYWITSPEKGQIVIYDSSYILDKVNKKDKKKYMNDIDFFEKSMSCSGIQIFHIVIDKAKQFPSSGQPDVFIVEDIRNYDNLIDAITKVINSDVTKSYSFSKYRLSDKVSSKLSVSGSTETYPQAELRIKKLQDKINKYHRKLIKKGIGLNIVFQGIDAAGKSSTIRRLTKKMVPHMFNVYGFGAPTPREAAHHYLWRFWDKVADKGQIAIFDRSWWEQVLAQRVLKLDKKFEERFEELNIFEKNLKAHKSHTLKFFMCIDKDTQQARFDERKNNPLKTWKVSASDEETRKQWDEYQVAFTDLLNSSDWVFIDSRNKINARLSVLHATCKFMKKILKRK